MLSKNKQKYIHSLEQKKYRLQEGVFVAEGVKCVGDLLREGYKARLIVCTEEWKKDNGIVSNVENFIHNGTEYYTVTSEDLRKCSFLQHPQHVLAVFPLPTSAEFPNAEWVKENLCLALDGVQDPGNMGTIIRIADWFGIKNILCSKDTVDAYSPKTVQATMGSIARVSITYGDLDTYFASLSNDIPIYGTLLDGKNLYETELSYGGIIVMGNEGKGISPIIRSHVSHRLFIPPYPIDSSTAESLNVAVATAVTIAEFRRRSTTVQP